MQKYANKIRSTGDTRSQKRVAVDLTDEQLHSSMQQSSQGQCSRAPSVSDHTHFVNDAPSVRDQAEQISIAAAFDKQSMLELHLKWTQAFMACGISFNVIRNPIFQDALMSTAKKGFVLLDYNKMRTEYVDKVKNSTEAILKRTVLDFLPLFGCAIALDGWTNCQK